MPAELQPHKREQRFFLHIKQDKLNLDLMHKCVPEHYFCPLIPLEKSRAQRKLYNPRHGLFFFDHVFIALPTSKYTSLSYQQEL